MARSLSLAVLLSLLAGPIMAEKQIYTISFGQRQLGTAELEGQRGNETLIVSLDNVPLGLKNGTYEGLIRTKGDEVGYLGTNRGSKTRDIAISRKADTVSSVTVSPASEMTAMTEAGKIPAGVIFPTELFAVLQTGNLS